MPTARRPAVHNRRYSDFWRQRRNQCWAGFLVAGFCMIAVVGVVYLIHNGINKKATYSGDALLRVYPKSNRDQIFLQNFDTLRIDAQVWGLPLNPSVPVFLYVKAGAMHRVEKALGNRNMTHDILIPDMQKLIDREEWTMKERRSQYESQEFDLEIYHPLEEITTWLENIQELSPFITINSTGKTHEGRDLLLVKISSTKPLKEKKTVAFPVVGSDVPLHHAEHEHENHEKPIIYINCGVHAREWVAVSSCIWIIDQLANATSEEAQGLSTFFDIWILPVGNPDGYAYTWAADRMWRKNRSPGKRCQGVDLNRNFDVDFNSTSRNACSSGYGGPAPESEPETKAMIALLNENRHRVKAALFMHSFSQLLLSPYSLNRTLPKDYAEMERVMEKTVEGLKSVNNTEYLYGTGANVLYAAYGTTVDYCYEKLGILYTFLLELRDTGTNGFILPLEQIKPTAMEAWYGLLGMASAIKENLPDSNAL